ncbi:NADH dehydrogenase (ubiquinone) 1 beta subcomplex subunit 10-B [Cucumis melo var. makuwa]|uniref:NADH dehydrogenase (Ubiquinone) 1 beta subcomplex subunit 10-B n=1 Tax=Cucumis melo var. makuwa TaxID=1194695 RepID=A0A5D3BJ03_CUCMM|nr:NADH dehydrogenase (ubiquinone) 1 beta subcomplex subunit 10-B [Cucumis melo var. makuwa]
MLSGRPAPETCFPAMFHVPTSIGCEDLVPSQFVANNNNAARFGSYVANANGSSLEMFDESPPDDFDPENPYKDPVAMLEMREYIVREKWIDIEKAKILREKLRWCYRIEGVNHLQKCRHLVQQYLDSTRGIGWGKDGRHPSLHGSSLFSSPVLKWSQPNRSESLGGTTVSSNVCKCLVDFSSSSY